jgi:hypothetical protein
MSHLEMALAMELEELEREEELAAALEYHHL